MRTIHLWEAPSGKIKVIAEGRIAKVEGKVWKVSPCDGGPDAKRLRKLSEIAETSDIPALLLTDPAWAGLLQSAKLRVEVVQ